MVRSLEKSTLINIQIKAGTGKKALKGLESMHNVQKTYDVSKNWADEINRHFGLKLDKCKYSIRRNAGSDVPKHNLGESIRVLISEFKKVRNVFSVTIVANTENASPIKGPARPVAHHSGNSQSQPHQQGSSVAGKIKIAAAAANGRVAMKREGGTSGGSGVPDAPIRGQKRTAVDVHFPENDDVPPRVRFRHLVEDEDAMSQASQDAEDDLNEIGVTFDETTKDRVIERLTRSWTTSSLQKIEHKIRELKKNERKFNQWLEEYPGSNLLRDVFQI